MSEPVVSEADAAPPLDARRAGVLLASIMVVALCGIVYELIIGAASSYLMGDSVYQFSFTIGFFMAAMGLGSYLSRFLDTGLIETFIIIECVLAVIGGLCGVTLFLTFAFAPWLYTAAQFGFIIVIGALVGLEIPILTRVLAERAGARRSVSDVLSLDYLGALFGSVAFPLLLLPSLGLIGASFAIGLANALVALLNVLWLRAHLRRPRVMAAAAALTAAALIALTAGAAQVTSFARHHLFFDTVIYETQTPYQNVTVTRNWRSDDLRLFIDGHLQFSQNDEHRYHEALVHPALSLGPEPRSVLVLGGGDGLAAREILKHPTVERIDLVDIDPAMTALGTDFAPLRRLNQDSLADPRVTLINQDAFIFARETDQRYDHVIIDFPDPHNAAVAKLYSVEFYALVRGRMTEDGVLVTQSSSPYFARRAYWGVAATLEAAFESIDSYQIAIPSFGVWGFHLATSESLGEMRAFPEGLRFMTPDTFAAAQAFPPDIARLAPGAPNSIFAPNLYQLYRQDELTHPLDVET